MNLACPTQPAAADGTLVAVRDAEGAFLCHATPEQVEQALATGRAELREGGLWLLRGARRDDERGRG